jgi:hypothetical protein
MMMDRSPSTLNLKSIPRRTLACRLHLTKSRVGGVIDMG